MREQTAQSYDKILGGKLSVIQPRQGYRFSIDSVLLARFLRAREGSRILDLGAGCGVVSLIIADLLKPREVIALEIDAAMAELIKRNASSNGFGNISAICGDFRQRRLCGIEPGSFDAVVANPPYRAVGSGRRSPNPARQTARQEEQGVLEDFVKGAAKYARFGGAAVMVMTAARGAELISLMRLCSLEPKRMRLVHPRIELPASVLLVEARRGGGVGVTIEPPLVIYSSKGCYTEETRKLLRVDLPIERGRR